MQSADVTIVIPARNAARTIARAISSAIAERPARVVLVNHSSSDDTVDLALRAAAGRLDVLTVGAQATLGEVRRAGLEAVDTRFGMWLDADDELLAGRTCRLRDELEKKDGDLAFDEIDLHDGATGTFIKRLSIPPFLRQEAIVRIFERNYLPGPGVPAFRTEAAKRVSYDPALHGAEDFDFVLRAIAGDLKIVLVREVGYRQFAYPATLSRNLDNQLGMCRVALRKHGPAAVAKLFAQTGYDERRIAWAMVSFLCFRGDYFGALDHLEAVERLLGDRREILEPDGPNAVPEGWRLDFYRGTLSAMIGRHEQALQPLQRAVADRPAPEALNNLGVALAAVERRAESAVFFAEALKQFPGYVDACENLRARRPARLTLHPLRREPTRSQY